MKAYTLPSQPILTGYFGTLFFCYRLGEVTLKDFKAAIDREGNHRYHFKALDPEFGTVKEEVKNPWGVGRVLLVTAELALCLCFCEETP